MYQMSLTDATHLVEKWQIETQIELGELYKSYTDLKYKPVNLRKTFICSATKIPYLLCYANCDLLYFSHIEKFQANLT